MFRIDQTSLADVVVAESRVIADQRGEFSRLFCLDALAPWVGDRQIVQINHSYTARKGSVRGLHYQLPPAAEMKMVRCLRGRVWDVAVDLRQDSPTFLQWHAEVLSAQNRRMMVIPEGCAHGFQTLEQESELVYLHTAQYTPELERGVRYDDPSLGITWPFDVADISPRDTAHAWLGEEFLGVDI